MPVDVQTQITIRRPRGEVAAYAADPDNATEWYEKIKSVQWKTERPLTAGTKINVRRQIPRSPTLLHLRDHRALTGRAGCDEHRRRSVPDGTTYTWKDAADGATSMTLRNRGEPSGFSKLTAPMLAAAMRRANRKDLKRLKNILERRA